MKNNYKRDIAFGFCILMILCTGINVLGAEIDNSIDRMHTENNSVNLFLYNDIYETNVPELRFTLTAEEGFNTYRNNTSAFSGVIHLRVENNIHIFNISIQKKKNGGGGASMHLMDQINNTYLYSLIFHMDVGTISFEFSFFRLYYKEIYPVYTEYLNDDTVIDYMYDNYFYNNCYLDDELISNETYHSYYENHSVFGVIYAMGDKMSLDSISIQPYKEGSNNSISDYRHIFLVYIILGISIVGFIILNSKKWNDIRKN